MNRKAATTVASILGAAGLLLILAGPAFALLPSRLALFAAIACWVVFGLIRALAKKDGRGSPRRGESDREDRADAGD